MRLKRESKPPRVEMLPLMDVVFLLLVFFIYAMMTMSVHRGASVTLPSSGTAVPERRAALALTLTAGDGLFLDAEPVTLETLPAALAAHISVNREGGGEDDRAAVKVFADKAVDYQELYRVLDCLKAAGVTKISLQAARDTGQ